MGHENEAMLRTAYDAAGQGDINPLMEALAEDVIWRVSGHSPLAGEYRGKSEVLSFFGKTMELYGGTLRVEVLDALANDHHGVVLTHETGQHAGKMLEFRCAHVWKIAQGKLVEFGVFYSDAYHQFWA